jgi:hypothetical protein
VYAAGRRAKADARRVDVTKEQAQAMRFLGSPSIRIDVRDVERVGRRNCSFVCRIHATANGLHPLPSKQWLRDALDRAPDDPSV